ncbi:GntR family transcriptional regulator [Sinorhizobium glycinis]|uniref:GntR family transcriptional regulator n=1 Tax=Sinorhizobium glycinis TaxID=1472378 RepID=A0A178XQ01_9HYPH|nr:GntR family transcriptional regulator [Sinorhizobium glycinis]OAP36635.1 GntR family transcriptional regulator [Sinorhizobium glycinis]
MRPVKKQTFREQIVDELKAAIMSGRMAPGSPISEADLAVHFGVSRGPLREALRHLIEEGFLVAVPYTGTRVLDLTLEDLREISSLRTELEIFAFKLVWPRRDAAFGAELAARCEALKACSRAGDGEASIATELALHSFVFETCGHRLLLDTWQRLKGRLQLYWATHHRAHDRRVPEIDAHDRYVALAIGNDFDALAEEIRNHMKQGLERTERFVMAQLPAHRSA